MTIYRVQTLLVVAPAVVLVILTSDVPIRVMGTHISNYIAIEILAMQSYLIFLFI